MMTKTAPRKKTLWATADNIVNSRNRGCKKEKQRFKKLDGGRGGDCFLYLVGSKSCSQKYDMRVDRMMESDVAKPLRMLSAYLMTAAMTRPPSAWRNNKHMDTDGRRHDLYEPTGSLIHKIKSLLPKRLDNISDSFGGKYITRWQCEWSLTCSATTVQVTVLYPWNIPDSFTLSPS